MFGQSGVGERIMPRGHSHSIRGHPLKVACSFCIMHWHLKSKGTLMTSRIVSTDLTAGRVLKQHLPQAPSELTVPITKMGNQASASQMSLQNSFLDFILRYLLLEVPLSLPRLPKPHSLIWGGGDPSGLLVG